MFKICIFRTLPIQVIVICMIFISGVEQDLTDSCRPVRSYNITVRIHEAISANGITENLSICIPVTTICLFHRNRMNAADI